MQSPIGALELPQPVDAQDDGLDLVLHDEPGFEIQLDVDHDDAPLTLRLLENIVGQAVVPSLAVRNL
jgi:hypothetical protein